MKICHTSDWHIGRSLYGRRRYDEFRAFLDWLAQELEKQSVDALLISGDIFDTSTPGNQAQELYYRFIGRVATGRVRHIVVIGGNHDSPSFLNAPKEILKSMSVHVVGAATGNPADEVVPLHDASGRLEAVVCAVPYLRDRDLRRAEPGENLDKRDALLIEGLKRHYQEVVDVGRAFLEGRENVPLIAMGHLFTAGGKTADGDGIRDLYVGSLAHVGTDSFPEDIDYLALGHLHTAQKAGGKDHIRYCGSPIPMGFSEAEQEKIVIMAEVFHGSLQVTECPVPCFQPLARVRGDLEKICESIDGLIKADSNAWLEIEYTGEEVIGNLREVIDNAMEGGNLEVRRIRNRRLADRILHRIEEEESLDDLDAMDVFHRCLDAFQVPEDQRPGLIRTYAEAMTSLYENDTRNR